VHPKVPAGFGGRLRGKGPQQRDLAAQPILLGRVLRQDDPQMSLAEDQDVISQLSSGGQDEAFGETVRSGISR
jgi:hypothetical protein